MYFLHTNDTIQKLTAHIEPGTSILWSPGIFYSVRECFMAVKKGVSTLCMNCEVMKGTMYSDVNEVCQVSDISEGYFMAVKQE